MFLRVSLNFVLTRRVFAEVFCVLLPFGKFFSDAYVAFFCPGMFFRITIFIHFNRSNCFYSDKTSILRFNIDIMIFRLSVKFSV